MPDPTRTTKLTPMEQAMNWERMSGERLSDAERKRITEGGEFTPPHLQTTAVLTDRFEIVVVRADTSSERHGRFASIDDAIEWAMRHRDNLRLASTASWYVQETSA